jgi:integrase/recombinase XerD
MARRGERTPRVVPGDPTDPHGFPRLVAEWCEAMAVRGYSARTIDGHHHKLVYLAAWLAERDITRPKDVTKAMLDRYQRHLFNHRTAAGRPLAFRTQQGRLVAIRMFFRWARQTNRILLNPAADLQLPRGEQRLPAAVLTATEAEAVLAQPDLRRPSGIRDRTMLETFYACGIRRTELARLQVSDFDIERRTLHIRQGKGRRDRIIPTGERSATWLQRYLFDVRPRWARPCEQTLFVTVDGTPFSGSRLTAMVRGYIAAAGIDKPGSCHLLRHTMATLMLEGGADIRFIQQMLGHTRLDSTQVYTRVAVAQLAAIHTACHPAASNSPRRDPGHDQLLDDPDDVDE